MIQLGGRPITRLVFADENGASHPITEVWANGQQVWDGRISVTVFTSRGSMAFAGSGAIVSTDINVDATGDTYAVLSGSDAVVENSVTVITDAGAFAFTGVDADLILDTVVFTPSDPARMEWIGREVTPQITYGAFFDSGLMVWDAPESVVSLDAIVESSPAAFFSMEGQEGTVFVDTPVDASSGVFDVSGNDAVVTTSIGVNADGGVSVWSSVSAVVSTSHSVAATPGAFDATGGSITPEIVYFSHQRMNKSGLFTPSAANTRQKVTGWTGDVTNNEIVFTGAGTTHIWANVVADGTGSGSAYIVLNGADIGTVLFTTQGLVDCGEHTVTAGDRLWMESTRSASATRGPTTGTYVEHNPV